MPKRKKPSEGEPSTREPLDDASRSPGLLDEEFLFHNVVKSGKSKLVELPADSYRVVLSNDLSGAAGFSNEAERARRVRRRTRCRWAGCGVVVVGDYDAHLRHLQTHSLERVNGGWHCQWREHDHGAQCTTVIRSSDDRIRSHVMEVHMLWKWACRKCGGLIRLSACEIRKHYENCRVCPKCTLAVKSKDATVYRTHVEECRVCRACRKIVEKTENYDDHVDMCIGKDPTATTHLSEGPPVAGPSRNGHSTGSPQDESTTSPSLNAIPGELRIEDVVAKLPEPRECNGISEGSCDDEDCGGDTHEELEAMFREFWPDLF